MSDVRCYVCGDPATCYKFSSYDIYMQRAHTLLIWPLCSDCRKSLRDPTSKDVRERTPEMDAAYAASIVLSE